MPNRYTYAEYSIQGRGCRFRGSSPAWPYVGRSRGGLSRCVSPSAYRGWSYWQPQWRPTTYGPQMSRQQEIDTLKNERQFIENQLNQINDIIKEMEKQEDN